VVSILMTAVSWVEYHKVVKTEADLVFGTGSSNSCVKDVLLLRECPRVRVVDWLLSCSVEREKKF